MDLRNKVVTAFKWSASLRLASQLLTWAITLIVVRLLTPADYVLMAAAMVFIALLTLANELGVGMALIQRKGISDQLLRDAFGLVIIANVLIFLALLSCAPLIARFFDNEQLLGVVRVLSVQFLGVIFSVIPQALLVRKFDFKTKSIIDVIAALSGGLTTLSLALNGGGVWSLVYGSLAQVLVRAVGSQIAAPYLSVPGFSLSRSKDLLTFGGLITIDKILWYIYTQTDTVIIGRLLGTDVLGIYAVAMHLASMPMQRVNGIVNEIAFPAFANIEPSPDILARHVSNILRVLFFFAFPIFYGMSSVSPEIVHSILGVQWTGTIPVLAILSLVMPIRMASNILTSSLQGIGRPGVGVINVLIALIGMPVAFLVAVKWGLVGVCIAWVIAFPLVFLAQVRISRGVLGITIGGVWETMVKPLLASIMMALCVVWVSRAVTGLDASKVSALAMLVAFGAAIHTSVVLAIDRKGVRQVRDFIRG